MHSLLLVSWILGTLSKQSQKKTCICVNMHTYTSSKSMYLCVSLSIIYHHHEFLHLIQFNTPGFILAFLFSSFVTPFSDSKKSAFHHSRVYILTLTILKRTWIHFRITNSCHFDKWRNFLTVYDVCRCFLLSLVFNLRVYHQDSDFQTFISVCCFLFQSFECSL